MMDFVVKMVDFALTWAARMIEGEGCRLAVLQLCKVSVSPVCSDQFCIQSDEICIQNDGICIQNDDLIIKKQSRLGNTAVVRIAQALETNTSIRELSLGENEIGDKAAKGQFSKEES